MSGSGAALSSPSTNTRKPWGRIAQGETLVAIARGYDVSHMTISRLAGVTFMQ